MGENPIKTGKIHWFNQLKLAISHVEEIDALDHDHWLEIIN